MIDPQIIEQLKTVFQNLEGDIELAVWDSSHAKQQELLDMLDQEASTSGKISVTPAGEASSVP